MSRRDLPLVADMMKQMSAWYSPGAKGIACWDTCSEAWGDDSGRYQPAAKKTNDSAWTIPFFKEHTLAFVNNTGGPHLNYMTETWEPNNFTNGITPGASDFQVNYCMAEHVDQVCHVGVSNVLLLAVTICVLVKTITAIIVTVVLARRDQAPLVTLGDAIVSFIERPDPATVGMCRIAQRDIRQHLSVSHRALLAGPRSWTARAYRRYKIVPVSVWISSYALFAIGIGVISFFIDSVLQSLGQP